MGMIDREKVIKGLEEINKYFFDIYRNDTDSYKCQKAQEYSDVMIDAISILNKQEAVEPTFKQGDKGIFIWCCGSCGAYMYHIYDGIDKAKEYAKYCRQCGRRVKWNG